MSNPQHSVPSPQVDPDGSVSWWRAMRPVWPLMNLASIVILAGVAMHQNVVKFSGFALLLASLALGEVLSSRAEDRARTARPRG